MPSHQKYANIGRLLAGLARAGKTPGLQGAGLGAVAGGGYGAGSEDTGVLSGILRGALVGGLGGAGMGAGGRLGRRLGLSAARRPRMLSDILTRRGLRGRPLTFRGKEYNLGDLIQRNLAAMTIPGVGRAVGQAGGLGAGLGVGAGLNALTAPEPTPEWYNKFSAEKLPKTAALIQALQKRG